MLLPSIIFEKLSYAVGYELWPWGSQVLDSRWLLTLLGGLWCLHYRVLLQLQSADRQERLPLSRQRVCSLAVPSTSPRTMFAFAVRTTGRCASVAWNEAICLAVFEQAELVRESGVSGYPIPKMASCQHEIEPVIKNTLWIYYKTKAA